jgi:hypothetical protein
MAHLILVSGGYRRAPERSIRSRRGGPPPFDDYRDEVEQLLRTGTPFRDVEDAIAQTDLTPEQQAALWLLAWSLIARDGQDDEPRRALAVAAATTG